MVGINHLDYKAIYVDYLRPRHSDGSCTRFVFCYLSPWAWVVFLLVYKGGWMVGCMISLWASWVLFPSLAVHSW